MTHNEWLNASILHTDNGTVVTVYSHERHDSDQAALDQTLLEQYVAYLNRGGKPSELSSSARRDPCC